jgi:hypothetical protein
MGYSKSIRGKFKGFQMDVFGGLETLILEHRGKLFFAEVDSRAIEDCRRQEAKIGDSMVISVDHASSQFLIEIERKL